MVEQRAEVVDMMEVLLKMILHLDMVEMMADQREVMMDMVELKKMILHLDMMAPMVDLEVNLEVEALDVLVVLDIMQILLVGTTKLMLGVSEMMLI